MQPTSADPANKIRGFDWFLLNLKIGALSFGGAGRILLYKESVVEKIAGGATTNTKKFSPSRKYFPAPIS